MAPNILFLLSAAFLAATAVFLLHRGRRNTVLEKFHASRRRVSGAKTPPRSLSPAKKATVSTDVAYAQTFPPSRRCALVEVGLYSDATLTSVDYPSNWQDSIIPLEASYLDVDESYYTPCGISVREIKALGDFPDYAALSGVPLPQPYPDFDINKALPRPYRPFRWAYHQTMSLTKMENDWWLELENSYVDRIKQRQDLFRRNGKAVLQALPGSELACKELMEMALQFLCARYPKYFNLDIKKKVFYNSILKSKTDLSCTPPLHVLLDNVPEDFAIMLRDDKTGGYVFRAGIICSALGWNVASKIGLRLHEIHAPIPDYKEKMQFSMDRYFAKKPTDKCIQRGSWGLEVDQPLYMPPGDPHEVVREQQLPDLNISRCHLRVDWQTLRRLPLSGSIVFNFKALFTPVEDFREEPYIPALVLKIMNEGKKNLMDYKNTWHVEHVVKPEFEKYHKEQMEKGMVPADWEPRTLDESPYYPGWDEMWRKKQGL